MRREKMDKFKLSPGIQLSYYITTDEYESRTNRAFPYCQNDKKGKTRYFAVCPECDNPIRIISLHPKSKNSPKPYGRHFMGDVSKIANYSQIAYDNCPYACPNSKKDDLLPTNSAIGNAKKCFIKKHFDLIIHVMSKETGIRISQKLAKELLGNYLKNQGWRYRFYTINNLPWTLPVFSEAITLKGRYLDPDSSLFKNLSDKYPDMFEGNCVKFGNNPYNPKFVLINYKRILTQNNHHLSETIKFRIINQDQKSMTNMYEETLIIDQNLLAETNYYSRKLLDIADKLVS